MTHVADEQKQQDEGIAKEAGAKAKEGVATAASAAGEKAGELREQSSQMLRQQLDERSTHIGSQARSVAQALRGTTDDLRQQGSSGAATVAEQAAEKIEQLGGYLERMDGQSLMRDVQGFARRRPWAVAGIGVVAGLLGARFAKASGSGGGSDAAGNGHPQRALPPVAPAAGSTGYGSPAPAAGVGADPADMPLGREQTTER